ncbi:MAG: DUF721 domain-containing protein [Spirochaetes bacterium]|nr:DUF721 domain-containing protein [Spirochaetota bacterium]
MADSRIKSVSDLLLTFFDRETAAKGESYSNFRSAWRGIAGQRLAEHSRPVDVRHGILIVETEHQGWGQLLQLQQEKMLDEIGRKFPEFEIKGIAFRLASKLGPAGGGTEKRAAADKDFALPSTTGKPEERPETQPIQTQNSPPAASLPPEIRAAFERLKRKSKG